MELSQCMIWAGAQREVKDSPVSICSTIMMSDDRHGCLAVFAGLSDVLCRSLIEVLD